MHCPFPLYRPTLQRSPRTPHRPALPNLSLRLKDLLIHKITQVEEREVYGSVLWLFWSVRWCFSIAYSAPCELRTDVLSVALSELGCREHGFRLASRGFREYSVVVLCLLRRGLLALWHEQSINRRKLNHRLWEGTARGLVGRWSQTKFFSGPLGCLL